jgi:hypothetical protein
MHTRNHIRMHTPHVKVCGGQDSLDFGEFFGCDHARAKEHCKGDEENLHRYENFLFLRKSKRNKDRGKTRKEWQEHARIKDRRTETFQEQRREETWTLDLVYNW